MFTLIAQQVIDIESQKGKISPFGTLGMLIQRGANLILVVGSLAFLMYLLIGGFTWLTAGGDKGKVEKARDMITQGIIGIAILASVFALYGLVLRFFGITNIGLTGQSTGGASSNSTSECSDWCAGPATCRESGGRPVARMCSYDACAKDLVPCKIGN